MHIHNVQSNNYKSYNSPTFGILKISESAQKWINSRWADSVESQKINAWQKELAETRQFDLVIHSNEIFNKLWMSIEGKSSSWLGEDCRAPLHVIEEPVDNRLFVYGEDILFSYEEPTDYSLKFNTNKEAVSAYNTLKKYQDSKPVNIIDEIAWAVDSVKILEQGTGYTIIN